MDRITRFYIDRFKALNSFELLFPKSDRSNLLCLIGKNGAGKSTVLQALDFVGQIFRGDIEGWLQDRSWQKMDLLSLQHRNQKTISIQLEGDFAKQHVIWDATYNVYLLKCTSENITIDGEKVLSVKDSKLTYNNYTRDMLLGYQGSILSQFENKIIRKSQLRGFVEFVSSMYSFDTIDPSRIRTKKRKSNSDNIGRNGYHLSDNLSLYNAFQHKLMKNDLASFYPFVCDYIVKVSRGDCNELSLLEFMDNKNESFKKRVISAIKVNHTFDGALRTLAILAELKASDSFVMFDEIENGFNPYMIRKFIKKLSESDKQILITTNNSVVINSIKQFNAEENIFLVYKDEEAKSQVKKILDLPLTRESLPCINSGEFFLGMNLDETFTSSGMPH